MGFVIRDMLQLTRAYLPSLPAYRPAPPQRALQAQSFVAQPRAFQYPWALAGWGQRE